MGFRDDLKILCDGSRTYLELSVLIGKSKSYTEELVREMNLPKPKRDLTNTRKSSDENLKKIEMIKQIADGALTSEEIADIVGCNHKYAQRILLKYDLPRLPQSPRSGEKNQAWVGGRHIDLDGYVLVLAPKDHQYSRVGGRIYEHRIVMEQKLGRILEPHEVVDHIDSLTIHNHPENLRVFASNADHLKATISGQVPEWSAAGIEKISLSPFLRSGLPVVDTYRLRKESGDVRLQTILRAWLQLDKDSPYLLCTRHWMERAGIVDFSRRSLEHHLQALYLKYT